MKARRNGRRNLRRAVKWIVVFAAVYALIAYVLLPFAWTHYEHQPKLAGRPMVTATADGIAGDALNIGLVGDREDVLRAMHAAGWFPADPITLKSSAEIIGSVLLHRPYRDAPVSPLYYDGRKEDLAFEQEDGRSASRRHHIRLWQVLEAGEEGRPVWLGAATFDASVGISHYTGQITHDIAPDIDAERDFVADSLDQARMVAIRYQVTGVGPTLVGRNGEGTRYYTDGEMKVLVLVQDGQARSAPAEILPAPPLVAAKDALWQSVANAGGAGP